MAENTAESIGALILSARESRGLSAVELGQRIGRPATTVRAWEQGRLIPDDDVISQLAGELELDARDLVGTHVPPPPIESDDLAARQTTDDEAPDGEDEIASQTSADEAPAEEAPAGEQSWRSGAWREGPDAAPGTLREVEETNVGSAAAADQTLPDPYPAERIAAVRADEDVVFEERPASDTTPFDIAALAERAVTWVRNRWRRRRLLARAPTSVKSYVEDDRQATTYRIRQVMTAVALIVLILVLRWAWSQFSEAVSALFETLRTAI